MSEPLSQKEKAIIWIIAIVLAVVLSFYVI